MSVRRPVPQFLVMALWLLMAPLGQGDRALASAFDPPPGQGEPGSTSGGASRPPKASCLTQPDKTATLTPLAPKTYLGLTTQAHPTFWVYLPATEAKTLEFSLFDHHRQGLYQTRIAITNTGGLIPIRLPDTAPELRVNQSYSWAVALVCNPKRRPEDWVASGWIQRQVPNDALQQQLKRALTDADRVLLYRQSRFWYDAMALLLNSPQPIAPDPVWTETLKAAGLPQLADPRIQETANR
jgi:hypothetical protein